MTSIGIQQGTEQFYLALVVWREARGEDAFAQLGVAFTVLNRRSRPGWWGKSVDEIATKKWQYSSLTDPNDPQLTKWPLLSDPSWGRAWNVATLVLGGSAQNPVEGADSYYDDSLQGDKIPKWAGTARFCGKIGRLNFYDVDHDYEAAALHA